MDRRTFLGTAAKAAIGAVGLVSGRVFAQVRTGADLAFVNGVVVTMNPALPFAEALAVRAGRIMAVGPTAEIEALCDAQTQRVDLAGQSLSPGLIDAHSHLMAFGQMELYFVNLRPPRVHDFASLREVLAEAAAQRPAGEWIMARGFNEFDEGRFPRRQEIDPATPQHPALLVHWTGQYGIANTLALQRANLLRADVPDPYGGKYLREPRTGLPDGTLLHYPAIYSVYQPTMNQVEERQAALWGVKRFLEEGVTCVHDNFANRASAVQYVTMERAGVLGLRVRVYPYVWNLEHCRQVVATSPRYSGSLVRLQGIKLAVDGYPLMYRVLPQHAHLNIPMHPPDQFQAIISTIHQAGLQVDVHAAGDRGVDLTLEAFSQAAGGDDAVAARRHRIEHFLMYREASIVRAGQMGVPVCTQPLWVEIRAEDLIRRLGREQVERMCAAASFRRAGVHLCFGADVPASVSHRPLDSVRGAMARRTTSGLQLDRAEALSFLECLEAHTIEAAYAAFDEKEVGSLEAGKWADLAVWNRDLRQVTEANLAELQVTATYVGGKQVWRREAA